MNFTEEQLKEIENFGAVFFEPGRIAEIMELDAEYLQKEIEDKTSAVSRAYRAGMLRSEYELRVAEIELAKRGSSQAIEGAKKMITSFKINSIE